MKQTDILGAVRVASPCKASWEQMQGDERVRHCEACKKHVYNLSGMTRSEAEALVTGAEGKLCVRFYRRPDGTMLTQDCPVGVMALRKRMATTFACAATLFISLYASAASMARRQPGEITDKSETISVYEQARRVEAFRFIIDRLNPPMPPPRLSVTVGAMRPIIMGGISTPVLVKTPPSPVKSTTAPTAGKSRL